VRHEPLALPWLRPVVAVVVGALFFVPLYVVLANVIKNGADISRSPMSLPIPPTVDNLCTC